MIPMKRRCFLQIFACLFGLAIFLLLVVEIYLRVHYGLCSAVLMRADYDYEYIAQPRQDRKRLGNRVLYNSYSMRSGELKDGSLRVLCLGDSILNGGTLTDHEDLATTILSKELTAKIGHEVQVLNVSAGSWGPDNCYAWLNKHGDFGAKMIVLVVSSHDVHDTMTFVPVVGRMKSFPVRQYPLALIELWDRYLFPKSKLFNMTKDQADAAFRREHHIEATHVPFNPGFAAIRDYAIGKGIPFVIYIHASQDELKAGTYDQDGEAIIDFCKANGIPFFCDLYNGLSVECFRENDYLHYSAVGQALMAKLLMKICQQSLENCQ